MQLGAWSESWRGAMLPLERSEACLTNRNALQRVAKKDVERRIPSSSSSSSTSITSCCWLSNNSAATHVLCAMNNGSVCLLSAVNLSKVYLFESAPSPQRAAESNGDSRDHRKRRRHEHTSSSSSSPPPELQRVGLDAIKILPPAPTTAAAPVIPTPSSFAVCLAMDQSVQFCKLDPTNIAELKKMNDKSSTEKVLPYPSSRRLCGTPTVLWNRGGTMALVVLPLEADSDGPRGGTSAASRWPDYVVSCLERKTSSTSSTETGASARFPWFSLRKLHPAGGLLRHCGWWGVSTLLLLWSDGTVQLVLIADEGLVLLAEVLLLASASTTNVVKAATATESVSSPNNSDSVAAEGLLAVALELNLVACFSLHVHQRTSPEESSVAAPSPTTKYSLELRATVQTHCTQDIYLRDLAFIPLPSTVLALLLDSGAILFLDPISMELIFHRGVKRVGSSTVSSKADGGTQTVAELRAGYCLCTTSKPLSLAVVDHDTLTVLRPT